MSNLEHGPHDPIPCQAGGDDDTLQVLTARKARIGASMTIRRVLPQRRRRLIGPWCFLDHFGPHTFPADTRQQGMWVEAHPHTGLQTVTWLLEGEAIHRDSLGTHQAIAPGSLNVMTAGRGITHTEETPPHNNGRLHGVQLWVALPTSARHSAPAFEHHDALPRFEEDNATATLFMGEGFGDQAPATVHTPMMGADIAIHGAGRSVLPLERRFEHGFIVVEGEVELQGTRITPGHLAYLAPGRRELDLRAEGAARLMLVGGEPFPETVLMWWNFVSDNAEDLRAAYEDWKAGRRFGPVAGFEGGRLDAPRWVGTPKAPKA
ncbi:MAG: pirin family protein [Myxococcota bacterium]